MTLHVRVVGEHGLEAMMDDPNGLFVESPGRLTIVRVPDDGAVEVARATSAATDRHIRTAILWPDHGILERAFRICLGLDPGGSDPGATREWVLLTVKVSKARLLTPTVRAGEPIAEKVVATDAALVLCAIRLGVAGTSQPEGHAIVRSLKAAAHKRRAHVVAIVSSDTASGSCANPGDLLDSVADVWAERVADGTYRILKGRT